MVDDFRAYLLAQCILDQFSSFLATMDNPFGFKKGSSCSHAIYSIKSVIYEFIARGSTVNVYALDSLKVFDWMNHFVIFYQINE